jgi:hypothetical protein
MLLPSPRNAVCDSLREISQFERMRGGPGRTRTSNQTVMSGLAAPEILGKIGVFRRVHARSFASVHVVSVVNLWSVLGRCDNSSGGWSGGPIHSALLTPICWDAN